MFFICMQKLFILLDVFIFLYTTNTSYLTIRKKGTKNQYFNTFRTKNLICTYASTIQHGCEKKLIKKKMATENLSFFLSFIHFKILLSELDLLQK